MSKIRFDRAATIGLFHPASNLFLRHRQARVPILMYHGIRPELGGMHPYFETNTTPELFAQHMQFLRENGYVALDLCKALEALMVGRHDHRYVAITFDDGYRDFYTHAFPVLAEHGFQATVFIVTGLTGEEPIRQHGREYLTWGEIREMQSCGIRIGSHTVSHPELYRLSPSEVEYEIRQSKETIEDKLGESVRSFSYPYAFPEHDGVFVKSLKDLLQTHGYQNGVSTILGTAGPDHDWFFLPRLPVNSYDDLHFLAAKLEGGYDWLHVAQKFYKKTMKRFAASSARSQIARNMER